MAVEGKEENGGAKLDLDQGDKGESLLADMKKGEAKI
jgi:hypothetical protein